MKRQILVVCLLFVTSGFVLGSPSFSPPFSPDSSTGSIPEWTIEGSTSVATDFIRLTSDEKDMSGLLAHVQKLSLHNFEMSMEIRIHSGHSLGADGLVLWMSEEPISRGPVFGASATWKGSALVLDTYDNNAKDDHPFVNFHRNDGSETFHFEHDGSNTHIDGCSIKYRNAGVSKFYMKVENGEASLFYDARGNGNWLLCVEEADIFLPENGFYFTFSAATGGLSDNHDVISFKVNSLDNESDLKADVIRPPPNVLAGSNQPQPVTTNLNTNSDSANCLMFADCTNLETMAKSIENSLDALEESFGHSLLEIQGGIVSGAERIKIQIDPVVDNVKERRNDILALKQRIEDNVNLLRNTPQDGTTEKEDQSERQLAKLAENVGVIHRTLTQMQKEQINLVQGIDIHTAIAESGSGSNTWAIIALVLCVIQMIILLLSCCQRKQGQFGLLG